MVVSPGWTGHVLLLLGSHSLGSTVGGTPVWVLLDRPWVAHSMLTHIQDLLKHTPSDHPDYPLLQDALRISQNFLSSINEDIDPRRTAVTTPKGEVRQAGWHRGWLSPGLCCLLAPC